jgi:hypothetical protein
LFGNNSLLRVSPLLQTKSDRFVFFLRLSSILQEAPVVVNEKGFVSFAEQEAGEDGGPDAAKLMKPIGELNRRMRVGGRALSLPRAFERGNTVSLRAGAGAASAGPGR